MCVHEACTRSTAAATGGSSLRYRNFKVKGNTQHGVKQVSKIAGKNAGDVLEGYSKLRASLSLYSKSILEIVQRSQRPSDLDNN